MNAIGIDIGGTNTKLGLVRSDGNLERFSTFPTGSDTPFEDFVQRLKKEFLNLKQNVTIAGVGVGAPNGNAKSGWIEGAPNLGWKSAPIAESFSRALGLPVLLDNDANLAALGERLWGDGRGVDDFIVVTLGTGIGTGIYVDGKLLRGPIGTAGEGGHITIHAGGRECFCGARGHLEAYASVRGIKQNVLEATREDLSFHEIKDRYLQRDPAILKAFERAAEDLGQGLACMNTLFCPTKFILAGGVATIGDSFTERVEHYLNHFAFGPFRRKSAVVTSKISASEGAVLGAAALVFEAKL